MERIKVLVVDDSAFMRKMISNILNDHVKIEVIATARNGQDALGKIRELDPDLVTLDIEMPIMDGITTLKEIMNKFPRPVIMLSSLTKEGADKTVESMELGAVDFIGKPSGSISLNIKDIESEIISKVLHGAKVKANEMKQSPNPSPAIKPIDQKRIPFMNQKTQSLIGIGTSTGGPRALQQVVTRFPSNIPAPIAIVQHMPAGFTKSLAQRLDQLSQIKVKEAEDGERLENGVAYIAPGGFQFRVVQTSSGYKASVKKEAHTSIHQPSVDVLFESLAELTQTDIIAVVMTGMGADGTNGIIEMKKANPNTIVISEDEETCVVYGMPQAAMKTKQVDFVEPLPRISDAIVNQLKIRGE
ncbi:two-component system, chemotaxis family, response regulator CheB [Pelagirhabdus alkalitolerans]|uniref:Protein-glutamate methylesterase/protein-glutamine glutaminase n=1 Tax=Pelagirhabdus alkalitolerans TaxID=1612202 RepID=A0A1G6H3H4_9BACI|nr:chemotaxis response regulator protein-glutamate methylesterase [Pelagirhabdus alkalitolerans]SDB88860.1 two-component system, chemotaxis family, response regulator CheB [Pelagirhabdus alkalitolerans]